MTNEAEQKARQRFFFFLSFKPERGTSGATQVRASKQKKTKDTKNERQSKALSFLPFFPLKLARSPGPGTNLTHHSPDLSESFSATNSAPSQPTHIDEKTKGTTTPKPKHLHTFLPSSFSSPPHFPSSLVLHQSTFFLLSSCSLSLVSFFSSSSSLLLLRYKRPS